MGEIVAMLNKIRIDGKEYLLSGLLSPRDSRDFVAEAIFPKDFTPPPSLDYRRHLLPVRDQGTLGACAAISGACMKEYQEKKDIDLDEYLSPQFIYNNRENQTLEGMHCRDVMTILKNLGCCIERLYPYGKIEGPNKIPKKAYEDALNFKISGYAQVFTVDTLKQALFKNGPCLILMPLYKNYDKLPWYPKPNTTLLGTHVMTAVGYNSKGFIIRNSWGDKWQDKGYFYLPYKDWGIAWEVWTSIDEKSSKKDKYIYEGSIFKKIYYQIINFIKDRF